MATDTSTVGKTKVEHYRASNIVLITTSYDEETFQGVVSPVVRRRSINRSEAEDLMNALINILK